MVGVCQLLAGLLLLLRLLHGLQLMIHCCARSRTWWVVFSCRSLLCVAGVCAEVRRASGCIVVVAVVQRWLM